VPQQPPLEQSGFKILESQEKQEGRKMWFCNTTKCTKNQLNVQEYGAEQE